VAATLGWQWIILSMIGCLWLILFVVRGLPEGAEHAREGLEVGRRIAEFSRSLGRIMRGRTFWLGIGFALLAGAGFEAVGALCGTYLPDRGLSTETTGWFRVFVVVGAMIGGGLLGGMLTDRWGARPASLIFLLGLTGCNLVLSLAELQAATLPWLLGWIAAMYFGYGMFISASYALFMSLTEPRVAATQFSVFMAATNGCEVWSGWLGGQLVDRAGYVAAFFTLSVLSLAALPFLMLLRQEGSRRGR
jgi:predicted MFS family arabinose efflux permease